MNWLRKLTVSATMAGALAATLLFGGSANAQGWGGYGYSGGYGGSHYAAPGYNSYYRQPHYHAPSLHYDRVYHPEYRHWTPGRGLHTHGHYDTVPHYTPGHYHH